VFCFHTFEKNTQESAVQVICYRRGWRSKNRFLWFIFLRLNKTGFVFSTALQAGPLKTNGARKKTFLLCLVNFQKNTQ
jgi:hypothetical protein